MIEGRRESGDGESGRRVGERGCSTYGDLLSIGIWNYVVDRRCHKHLFDLNKSKMYGFNYQPSSLVLNTISLRLSGIVQLILFIVDSGCTKHMMGNLTLLCNFVVINLGIVHFGIDQFTLILGYGDLV
nr:integrase, catalytic region, zinc finger, CCHC-type, peptidase aspartic, catalytic [Tanacetum cinerariifolium]